MDKLGIELPLLLAQIINFSILVIILKKLLYQPILKSLQDRKNKIAASMVQAEEVKKQQEKLKQYKEELLREARDEGKVIINNAQKDAQKAKAEILQAGKIEADKFKEKHEKELMAKYEQLESQLEEKTIAVAVEMIKRVLPEILTGEQHHLVIRKQLTKIQKMAWNQ